MRRRLLIALLAVLTMAYVSEFSISVAQERKPAELSREEDRQVLKALLEEMRLLRLSLQRANTLNYRVQITLERVRLQQARVDSITRSVENVRARLNDLKNARPQMEEQIKFVEETLGRGTDQNRRAEIELQLREMKARLAAWSRDEEQLRVSEASLTSELQGEQSKLSELQGQLDNMLRQWEAP